MTATTTVRTNLHSARGAITRVRVGVKTCILGLAAAVVVMLIMSKVLVRSYQGIDQATGQPGTFTDRSNAWTTDGLIGLLVPLGLLALWWMVRSLRNYFQEDWQDALMTLVFIAGVIFGALVIRKYWEDMWWGHFWLGFAGAVVIIAAIVISRSWDVHGQSRRAQDDERYINYLKSVLDDNGVNY